MINAKIQECYLYNICGRKCSSYIAILLQIHHREKFNKRRGIGLLTFVYIPNSGRVKIGLQNFKQYSTN